jgi:hypothetical protein
MPTPEENMQSVGAFAEEVFGNKNLDYAAVWLGHNARQEGRNRFVSHFLRDIPGQIHDMVAAGDKVAIRATYRGTDKADSSPTCRPPENPSRCRPYRWSGSTTRDRSPSTGVSSTPSERCDSSACFRHQVDRYRRSRHPPWTALGGRVSHAALPDPRPATSRPTAAPSSPHSGGSTARCATG